MPWPYNAGARRGPARIDAWLPPGAWKLEHHSIDLAFEPRAALAAAQSVRLRDVPIAGALFTIRALPFERDMAAGRLFSTSPFLILDEEPGQEKVFGLIGPFWQFRRGRLPHRVARTPGEFRAALAERHMAAIGNFRAEPVPGGCRLWTETWVYAPRPSQAVQFAAYWMLIGLFSAWIRRLLLRAAHRRLREGAADLAGAGG